jgi:hypothetical protein
MYGSEWNTILPLRWLGSHATLPSMSVFSFLFIPLFALFRRSLVTLAGGTTSWNGVSSGFVLGSVISTLSRLLGRFWVPRGFGLDAFVAQILFGPFMIVILPVLSYFLLNRYLYHRSTRPDTKDPDEILNFSFAWLTPVLAIRTLEWNSVPDPVNLVLVPVLCTSLLLSLAACIRALGEIRILPIIAAVLGLIVFPFSASAAPWALSTHRFWIGFAASSVSILGVVGLETPLILRICTVIKSRKPAIQEGVTQA